jgi:outer membrane protein OmpA-like peptidoglycan-associated protein
VASDPDHDAIVDGDERCPVEGCVGTASFVVKDDRIVVPERVLFDLNSARVKHSGRDVIREFAKVLRDHPDWTHVTIEGHADVRGPEAYNATLSQSRADHVRDVLVRAGITPERIDAVGFGSTRPAVAGDDAGALQRNRRVEFVLTHGTPRGVQ